MISLALEEFHRHLNGRFAELDGVQLVSDYGDPRMEYTALQRGAGVLDLSFRSRLCVTGADRIRFLHGQVTNDVKSLGAGQGCYAALVTAKGKMESDLNLYCLPEEVLLDFEPGRAAAIARRLESFVVADDVQVVDVAPLYGLLSVQGPKAEAVVRSLGILPSLPAEPFASLKVLDETLGEIHAMSQPRLNSVGFDLFVPVDSLGAVADRLIAAAKSTGGCGCGWQALETARIEAGIPRFGADMDENNLPLECGIEARAVSYRKGCYIGQEILNRIHSFGHVNRELCGLRLADDLTAPPTKGDKLFLSGHEVGQVGSAVKSPALDAIIALGLVRREANCFGTELLLKTRAGEGKATVVELPFV